MDEVENSCNDFDDVHEEDETADVVLNDQDYFRKLFVKRYHQIPDF